MGARWRKAVGSLLILVFLGAYVWAALAIGEHVPKLWYVQLVYFLLVGVVWGVPLIPLMRWMNRKG